MITKLRKNKRNQSRMKGWILKKQLFQSINVANSINDFDFESLI